MKKRKIGIMGAMPEEIEGIIELLSDRKQMTIGRRVYYTGSINGTETVVVFSRWGKVAAATTVSALILEFEVTEIIFTGVAGAIHSDLNIGDIVIASKLIQHDMDARPIMPQYEVPLLAQSYFESSIEMQTMASDAVNSMLENRHLHAIIKENDMKQFNITQPKLYLGDIASGDQFFSSEQQKLRVATGLPSVLCVEMEGAAVAQVCFEYDIPFCIIRTISDAADEQSAIDFPAFIATISSKYSAEIIKGIYAQY